MNGKWIQRITLSKQKTFYKISIERNEYLYRSYTKLFNIKIVLLYWRNLYNLEKTSTSYDWCIKDWNFSAMSCKRLFAFCFDQKWFCIVIKNKTQLWILRLLDFFNLIFDLNLMMHNFFDHLWIHFGNTLIKLIFIYKQIIFNNYSIYIM